MFTTMIFFFFNLLSEQFESAAPTEEQQAMSKTDFLDAN